ncbi:MAG: deoxynucleoside kinase [Alistipes sp.]|nr:deoxynucleoside kinase [Alistipes sp.]
MYIAIAGNIGCGKTSLTQLLAERIGITAYYEEVDNPYIGDFYEDMTRWSFNLQIYFLGQRIRHAQDILATGADLIQDRTIYEDAYIFAANLHESGWMSSRDFDTYLKIFDLSTALIPTPNLLIYLKASVPTLIHQIQKRGRAYEMNIEEAYLERLNQKYTEWIEHNYSGEVIVIDVDHTDFIANPSLLDPVVQRIQTLKHQEQSNTTAEALTPSNQEAL